MHHLRVIALLVLSACAHSPTATSASGTLRGYSWSTDAAEAWFYTDWKRSDVSVRLGRDPYTKLPSGQFVSIRLDGKRCDGRSPWRETLPSDSVTIGESDAAIDGGSTTAIDGHVDVLECDRDHLRLRFSARFADGGRVSGDVVVAMTSD